MKPERLEEYKGEIDSAELDRMDSDTPDNSWCAWVAEKVPPLITALESAWETNSALDKLTLTLIEQNKDLHVQLEASQQQLVEAECDVLNLQNDASHFNADHRHAHEYIKRLKIENHDLSIQLAASQAEVGRLRSALVLSGIA